MGYLVAALTIIALTVAAQKIQNFWRLTHTIKYVHRGISAILALTLHSSNHPGFRTLFSDRFALFSRHIRGITPGFNFAFLSKHAYFEKAGWDVLAAVSLDMANVSVQCHADSANRRSTRRAL